MDEQLQKFQTGLAPLDFRAIEPVFHDLDRFLTLRTYLSGYALSDADKAVWTTIRSNKVALGLIRRLTFPNVTRWFTHIETTYPELLADAKPPGADESLPKTSGNRYNIKLQDTENGVVTRFPPEPS